MIDFIIGALLMNAMPHLIFGLTKTRYLSLFGYSTAGNIAYALLQLVICLALFHYQYGIENMPDNGIFLGSLVILVIFFVLGKTTVLLFGRKQIK